MSRTGVLWLLFALQAICCAYFIADIASDIFWPASSDFLPESDVTETLVTAALFLSMVFTGNELRQMFAHQTHLEDQIKVASGAFGDVLEARFDTWGLTNAEREVAILAINGFSITEMAELRDTRPGTIKAQCAAVYRKANVSGRLQLLSVFPYDLLADDLMTNAGQATT